MNAESEFRDAIRAAGLIPPDMIEPGKFHKFPGEGKGSRNTAAWCKLFPDGMGGIFGDYSTGLSDNWQAKREKPFSASEREAFKRHVAEARKQAEADQKERQAEAANKAAAIWEAAKRAPADHPYLKRKGIKAHGARLHNDALVLPVRDASGALHSLQFIDGDGDKQFMPSGKVKGCYFSIGNPKGATALCIAEGFATGATIHEATGYPVAVAFNAGNLGTVAKAMRERFAELPRIVCADDDALTEGNPGITKATEAARSVGGLVAVPDFGESRQKGQTDFNDMAALHGLEAVRRAIADASTPARREHQPEPDNAPDDEPEARHVNQPRPSESMLYGLAGDVGKTATATTEANPYAVCMGFMSFLSGMAGRDIYLPVGNTRHHPRLFTLHVGRSSRGRKGDALSLVHRIRHAIDKRELTSGTTGGSLLGQVHTGGLSSREGLVMFIHNGFKQGKDEVPAIEDKRLWVVESEFANILQQSKRDGNTLSPALRDAWDGVSIKPATKSLPLWTTDPHIAIAAAITPTELVELMKARELSNGFANRFVIFWAERERLIPFPSATSAADLLGLVERTEKVLRFMKGDYPASKDNRAMTLSHEARTVYERLYRGLNATIGSPRLDGILERRAPMLLRMAMLFAMTDLTLAIEVRHIEAAQAWVTYWVDSVRYIFGEAADEASIAERQESADKLLAFLTQKGEATRTEITVECFNKHAPPGGLNAVIAELLNATPPKIMTMKRPRPGGNPGSPTTIYRPLSQNTRANSANSANCGAGIGFETLQDAAKSGRTLRNEGDETGGGFSDFAEFADSSQHENTDAGCVDTHTSHSSHSSHADLENSDDLEVF